MVGGESARLEWIEGLRPGRLWVRRENSKAVIGRNGWTVLE